MLYAILTVLAGFVIIGMFAPSKGHKKNETNAGGLVGGLLSLLGIGWLAISLLAIPYGWVFGSDVEDAVKAKLFYSESETDGKPIDMFRLNSDGSAERRLRGFGQQFGSWKVSGDTVFIKWKISWMEKPLPYEYRYDKENGTLVDEELREKYGEKFGVSGVYYPAYDFSKKSKIPRSLWVSSMIN